MKDKIFAIAIMAVIVIVAVGYYMYTNQQIRPEYIAEYDIDEDCDIDQDDIDMIISHYAAPVSTCPRCDVNGDGTIDIIDVSAVTSHVGAICPT